MKFTATQVSEFQHWEDEMKAWRFFKDVLDERSPPRKPAFFDLWKQGPDPLKLAPTQPICCPGGGLVPDNWTSNAVPERLPDTPLYQPDLL